MAINFILCLVATAFFQIQYTMGINNRPRSTIPPLNMALDDIPMFLTITIDDALHGGAHEKTELIMNHVNRNNEQIPLVYFVSNEFTNYSVVQQRYLQGCEIAVHTTTHTTNMNTDITKWYYEIKASLELLSTHADIPLNQIVGFRAPFLEKSDLSFQVLNGLEPKFLYDSTIVSKLGYFDQFDWPYTLDEYDPDFVYNVGQGPQRSYPGLWEIPMYYIYSDISNRNNIGGMDYVGNYTTLLQAFKANFLVRMTTNKAPMGIYLHSPWLSSPSNVNVLNDFIEWVLSLDNTWIVTNKDIINWINNPTTNAQYSYTNNNQLMNDKTTFTKCPYTSEIINTVQPCPQANPHDLTWDNTVLINSNIIITSTPDNILTTLNDQVCVSDIYTTYDNNTVYCGSSTVQDIVLYNDALYKCLWWTKSETPGKDYAWKFFKNCTTYTDSFFKATIKPYGTVSVFTGNVLDIDININPGYQVTDMFNIVSVTADNNPNNVYDLSIFADYQLTHISNVAKITIRFTEIIHSQYQIGFSFNGVSFSPTKSPTITTLNPSKGPTFSPTLPPSNAPSVAPSQNPSFSPSSAPTENPTFDTINPTINPSLSPTYPSQYPTMNPSINPTKNPTLNDLCMHDRYTFYDYNTMYCINGMDQKFVRYNDVLYQCKHPTQSETPESLNGEDVWVSRKQCVVQISMSTSMVEEMDEENDEITMEISQSVLITLVVGVLSFVILVAIGVCIVLCCIIRKQRRTLKGQIDDMLKLKSVASMTSMTSMASMDSSPIISI